MRTMYCTISGLVQGVGFRYFATTRARAHELRGWVRNLYNGDVEVAAQGDEESLQSFLDELRTGPRSAQVRNVRVDWQEEDEMYDSFEIRA